MVAFNFQHPLASRTNILHYVPHDIVSVSRETPAWPLRTEVHTMNEGFASGQFNVGYENRLDVRQLREQRVEKAQAARERAGLDAILVWKDENVRYLTDLRPQLLAGKS